MMEFRYLLNTSYIFWVVRPKLVKSNHLLSAKIKINKSKVHKVHHKSMLTVVYAVHVHMFSNFVYLSTLTQ